jgi:hypothetical protein
MARKLVNLSVSPVPDLTANLTRSVPDWYLCINFGTTFTTIAYIRGIGEAAEIFTVEGFPGDRLMGRNGTQVPTEIQYLTKKDDNATDDAPASKILHGYEISRRLELTELDPARADYIDVGDVKKSKLLLDHSSHLKGLRSDLLQILDQLKAAKNIKKNEDVIRDLIVNFLKQTKEVLERDDGFQNGDTGKYYRIHAWARWLKGSSRPPANVYQSISRYASLYAGTHMPTPLYPHALKRLCDTSVLEQTLQAPTTYSWSTKRKPQPHGL